MARYRILAQPLRSIPATNIRCASARVYPGLGTSGSRGHYNIRSQMMTFLIAGHETTSGLLTFAVWLLLENPEALDRARAQVDAVLGAETPTAAHLARRLLSPPSQWPAKDLRRRRPCGKICRRLARDFGSRRRCSLE